MQEGDFLTAEEWLDRAMLLDPLAAPFRADRAQVELARLDVGLDGDLDLAQERAREAVALDPYNPGYHVLLAEVLWRQGQARAALAEMRRAAELHPFSARRWEALGQMAAAAGDRRLARETLAELERRARAVPAIVPPELRTPVTTPALQEALARTR